MMSTLSETVCGAIFVRLLSCAYSYDKVPMALREQEKLAKERTSGGSAAGARHTAGQTELIELQDMNTSSTEVDYTTSTAVGANPSQQGVKLGGLMGASATDDTQAGGTLALSGTSGSSETENANPVVLRLGSFYNKSRGASSSDPSLKQGSAPPAARSAAGRAAQADLSTVPESRPFVLSDPPANRHSELKPASLTLDEQDASVRLQSTRRANPLYGKETTS